jgi:hypothetical protein
MNYKLFQFSLTFFDFIQSVSAVYIEMGQLCDGIQNGKSVKTSTQKASNKMESNRIE